MIVPDIFTLNDKTILVTGSTGHLGSAIAVQLAQAGALVLLNGRDAKKIEEQTNSLLEKSLKVSPLSFDITDDEDRDDALDTIEQRYGRLDGIVNNANLGTACPLSQTNRLDFEHSLDLNLTSPFLLFQKALPLLKKSKNASIVNISSMYGSVSPDPRIYTHGDNNPVYYGAAKGGMLQMTRYLACHLAAENIRVNSISPGPFPPETIKKDNADFHSALINKVPLGRIGEAHEVAGCVQFLLSEAASYITGVKIPIDGGWTAW